MEYLQAMSAVNLLSSLKEKPSDESPKDGSNQEGKFLYHDIIYHIFTYYPIYFHYFRVSFVFIALAYMQRFF